LWTTAVLLNNADRYLIKVHPISETTLAIFRKPVYGKALILAILNFKGITEINLDNIIETNCTVVELLFTTEDEKYQIGSVSQKPQFDPKSKSIKFISPAAVILRVHNI